MLNIVPTTQSSIEPLYTLEELTVMFRESLCFFVLFDTLKSTTSLKFDLEKHAIARFHLFGN